MKEPTLAERVAALEKQVLGLIVQRPSAADAEDLVALSQASLEDRVAALEKLVLQLLARRPPLEPAPDWRSTIGMFANDPVMKEIQEAGQKIREEDRRRTKKQLDAADKRRREAKRRKAKR
ncbi:MAG: hypothetical protein L0Z62_34870 [Gemmataceae bacterium]|nr:hypothetical protein [Gemmataceae bacterium]